MCNSFFFVHTLLTCYVLVILPLETADNDPSGPKHVAELLNSYSVFCWPVIVLVNKEIRSDVKCCKLL